MRHASFFAALALVAALLATILLGGVHHCRSTHYNPTLPATDSSESDFTPSIHPMFSRTTSPLDETVIPYLLYQHSPPDRDPHIYLNTIDVTDQYGYIGKSSVVVESLTVQNASGEKFDLITPTHPRTISLAYSGYVWNHEDLGAVSGDTLRLTVKGYVVTDSGEKKRFSHDQHWEKTSSTRTTCGLALMP